MELELQEANKRLELLASVDGLTQIANRRIFDEYLALEWELHRREQKPLSVILMDIDYFKNYNDYYGHQQGDDCLIQVAQTLTQVTKRATDLLARYGGEEFAAILPFTNAQEALLLAESMRRAIAELGIPHPQSEISDKITLSFGIASLVPGANNSPTDLIQAADHALYSAKNRGRDRCYGSFV